MLKMTRREFLRAAGAFGALAAMGSLGGGGLFESLRHEAYAESWVYSCCNMCGGQSGIKVKLAGGVVKKIEPNEYNPIGCHNIYADFVVESAARGSRMCPKGNAAIKSLYDPDRVKSPMIRNGDTWTAISWDQAVEEVASRLTAIRDRYGARALAWFSEDHSFTHIQQDFCDAFGTPNYHNHSNLCDVARKASFKYTLGDERPLPDAAHAKYILLFGWNPLEATKWAHLPAIFLDGVVKNGAKMVVVDPVFTKTAARADEWVPIRPGTDGAMALAMCQVIISENLYDQQFVTDWTYGFDQFATMVAGRTPEWAEGVTSVPAATIRRLARELAAQKPNVLIDVWSGPGQQANGTEGGRAIACLAGLLGAVDQPGCLIIPDKKGGKRRAKDPRWPAITDVRIDGRGTKYPLAHSSGVYIEAREAIIKQSPYPVKAGVFVFQNFMMSVPNVARNSQMMDQLELIICQDTHMSETASRAHILIPGSHFLERYDLNSNWTTFPSLGLRQPVVASWINGMPEYDFWIRVAIAMGMPGFDDPDGSGTPVSYEKLLNNELVAGLGITLDQLKALPGAVWIGGPTTYQKYLTDLGAPPGTEGVDWVKDSNGVVKMLTGANAGKIYGVENPVGSGKFYRGFGSKYGAGTETRKFQFASPYMQSKGLNPVPDYTPTEDTPTAAYPFYFVSWKPIEHTHTRTQNNVWLVEMLGDNPVWINAKKAAEMGIKDGDKVYVESPYGIVLCTANVTQRIHPEVVGFPRGFGHWALGSTAKGRGVHDGYLLPGRAEPLSGMARHKEVAVKVYKA